MERNGYARLFSSKNVSEGMSVFMGRGLIDGRGSRDSISGSIHPWAGTLFPVKEVVHDIEGVSEKVIGFFLKTFVLINGCFRNARLSFYGARSPIKGLFAIFFFFSSKFNTGLGGDS